MAVSRLSTNNGATSGATSYGAGYTPAAGALLLLTVNLTKETTGSPSITTPTGWTPLGTVTMASGAASFYLVIFGRWATGTSGDNAPSLSVVASGTQWTLEGWGGLDSTQPLPLEPSAGFSGTGSNSASTVAGNSITTSVANEWIYSAFGMRGPGGVSSFAWSGGPAADQAFTLVSTHNYFATGQQTAGASGSTVTPGATFTSSAGQLEGVLSFGFTPSSGGGGGAATPAAQLINA